MKKWIYLLLFFQLVLSQGLQALRLTTSDGSFKEPVKDLLTLFDISPTQPSSALLQELEMKWKQENKERWQMELLFEDKRDQILPLLKKIGCLNSVEATKKHYNYALVLGAVGKTMQRRLDFLYQEWERGVRFDQIVLLTGQRDLNPAIEEVPEGLKSETELFIYLYEHHPLKNNASCPMIVIDSPKEEIVHPTGKVEIRRPNTKKTIEDWLQSHPSSGSCLAISSQPFIGYQEAVLTYLLPSSFSVEGIGPGADEGSPYVQQDIKYSEEKKPYPMAIYLDTIVRWYLYESMHLDKMTKKMGR